MPRSRAHRSFSSSIRSGADQPALYELVSSLDDAVAIELNGVVDVMAELRASAPAVPQAIGDELNARGRLLGRGMPVSTNDREAILALAYAFLVRSLHLLACKDRQRDPEEIADTLAVKVFKRLEFGFPGWVWGQQKCAGYVYRAAFMEWTSYKRPRRRPKPVLLSASEHALAAAAEQQRQGGSSKVLREQEAVIFAKEEEARREREALLFTKDQERRERMKKIKHASRPPARRSRASGE